MLRVDLRMACSFSAAVVANFNPFKEVSFIWPDVSSSVWILDFDYSVIREGGRWGSATNFIEATASEPSELMSMLVASR